MSKKKLTNVISSAFTAVIITLAMVLSLTFTGCSPSSKGNNDDNGPTVSQRAVPFINHVMRIKTPITIDSGADIEAGYILYDFMTDEDREDETVKTNKELLDGYNEEYTVLKAEKDEADEIARQQRLSERFTTAVSNLPAADKLTLENEQDIEEAFALYEQLNAQSRLAVPVKNAYEKLISAQDRLEQLKEEAHLEEVKEEAMRFIGRVDALYGEDGEDEITLEHQTLLEDLLYAYDNLSDEVKEQEGVAEAKQKLDEAYAVYLELKDEDDVEKLLEYAEKLSPAQSVTLADEKDIKNAETIYKNMSEKALAAEGVSEAWEAIAAARARYDELFEIRENERIQAFIEAANEIPEVVPGVNVDITWFDMLKKAEDAYWILTYDSMGKPEVEAAFKRWDKAQKEFDKKGYRQLPMTEPGITFSGDTPAHLVLGGQHDNQAVTKPLYEFYSVKTKEELDKKAKLMLNVYVDGVWQGKVAIKFTDIGDDPGHLIMGSTVVNALKELEKTNANVHSGANFSFALSYEDKDGTMVIPSPQSKVSGQKVYSWPK